MTSIQDSLAKYKTSVAMMEARIEALEKQVKGLMSTVSHAYAICSWKGWGVPRPDQFMSTENAAPSLPPPLPSRLPPPLPPRLPSQPKVARPAPTTKATAPPVAVDVSKLEPYKYSPLNSDLSQVRYLSIEPSQQPSDPVQVRLEIANLEDASPHSTNLDTIQRQLARLKTAMTDSTSAKNWNTCRMGLSYQWGDPSDPVPIAVDGKRLYVTRNLHKALVHFRSADPRALLPHQGDSSNVNIVWWIDAVCINQEDLDERSSQVRLMTTLYRAFSVVHVWLGEEADDSGRAMQMMSILGREPDGNEMEASQYVRRSGQTHRYMGPGLAPVKLPDDPEPIPDAEKDKNFHSIVKLISREYFKRMWIRQEVALQENVKFHCGDQILTWDVMMYAISRLVQLVDECCLPNLQRYKVREEGSAISIFQQAEGLKHLRKLVLSKRQANDEDEYLPFRNILFHSRNSNATDGRDKIFAILPLINPDDIEISTDYRKTHEEVYKETALKLAQTSLDFFAACQTTESQSLPSWVPDFSKKWAFLPLLGSFEPDGDRRNVAFPFPYKPPATEYLAEQALLRTRGIIFDQVGVVSDLTTAGTDLTLPALQSLLDGWWEFRLAEWDRLREMGPPELPGGSELPSLVQMYGHGGFHDGTNRKSLPRKWGLADFTFDNYYGRSIGVKMYSVKNNKEFAMHPTGRAFQRHIVTADMAAELEQTLLDRRVTVDARAIFAGRKMTGTRRGAFALLPGTVRVGDVFAQFQGSELTYILRQKGNPGENKWTLLGDAFFIGGIQTIGLEEDKLRDIDLV